jgi:hypothetical protein
VRWVSADDTYEVIVFGKNITNNTVYDVGALGTRLAGTNNFISPGCAVPTTLGQCNMVQGVNGPAGYGPIRGEDATGHIKTFQVAPPALWGIEIHFKFD